MAATPEPADFIAGVLAAMTHRDLPRLRAALHPEFRHELVYPIAGMLDQQNAVQFMAMITSIATVFDRFTMTTHAVHAMRDPALVVAEFSVDARYAANRQDYTNRHCMFFRVRDGLLVEIREYVDTARLNALIRGTEDASWDMAIN